jgi:hypothetical protein
MTKVMHKLLIYLSIYFCLTRFGLSFSQYSEAGFNFDSGSSLLGTVLTPYLRDLNHCRSCTPVSEDGLKESPKYVSQK